MQLGQTIGPIIGLKSTMSGEQSGYKTQWLRLSDVLVIGPAMIFGALGKPLPDWIKVGMVLAGVATIGANLAQFVAIQRSAIKPATTYQPRVRMPTE